MVLRMTPASRFGLVVAAVVVLVDQLSKWWILAVVMRPPRLIEVTPFFNLVLGWNTGISFGLFGGDDVLAGWVLPAVAGLIVAFLAVWLARSDRRPMGISLGLIIGGALGNVVDRMRFGAVADFLDFHAFGYHWPAFNVADTAITVGAVLLLIDSLLIDDESRKKSPVDREETG
jgi:signal peptidase II